MQRLGLVALCFFVLSGCFLMPQKKSGKKAGSGSGLIVRDSIFMDRVGDGNTAALRFKTQKDAVCEMAFYSQEPNVQPTVDKKTVVPCSNQDQARSDFTEKLDGLRSDSLYFVILTAWEATSTKDKGDTVTVRESPGNSNVVTSGDGGEQFKELFVARLDLPLKAAEFHHNSLPQPLDIPSLKTRLTRQIGCQQGVTPKDAPFREAAKDILIKGLATRDLGAGTAMPHPDYPERLQLSYGSLNDGVDKWTFTYQLDGKDVIVPVRPISQILNMEMESTTIVNFDQPQLAEAEDALKLDPTKSLKFSWTTPNNLLDLSYMTIQIGRPDYEKGIYCVFPAGKNSAEIDAKYLQNLDDGKQVVLAELVSNQIWAKDGWLITIYDWRSGRVEK